MKKFGSELFRASYVFLLFYSFLPMVVENEIDEVLPRLGRRPRKRPKRVPDTLVDTTSLPRLHKCIFNYKISLPFMPLLPS